jgi:enoyl-CoA hydratase/carnithine racemase
MRDDLEEVFSALQDDPEVRVVILRGAGRAFCSGADLSEFLSAPSPTIARWVRHERDIYNKLINLPQPTIAALHGYVIGSGIELALCCDFRIAATNATFTLPETSLGFIPGAGATQLLPPVTGLSSALKLILTSGQIDADSSLQIGLVNRIVPRKSLLRTSEGLAHKLIKLPQQTVSFIKQSVNRGINLPLTEGLKLESRLTRLANSPGINN